MSVIRVAAVEYLNTIPFLQAIRDSDFSDQLDLRLAYPARCAEMFKKGEVDVALVPVGALRDFAQFRIITDYCIGCDGSVETVILAGEQPVEKMDKIYLDYQSRTSVLLIRVLLRDYFKMNDKELLHSFSGYEKSIKGRTGGVIIGDRAFEAADSFPFIYDLGQLWKEMTTLPFVFAVWVCRTEMAEEWGNKFNRIFMEGLKKTDFQKINFPGINKSSLEQYFRKKIDYNFDLKKRKALKKFLNYTDNL